MSEICEIGSPPWTRDDLLNSLEEFASIYANRPIKSNDGGMKAPQLFCAWFAAKNLQPDFIIESGVLKGQGTWAIEQAAPSAALHCIDPYPQYMDGYVSKTATYHEKDFLELDFSRLSGKNVLCFFDDHQNAIERIVRCQQFGFKKIMFEDNYPVGQGDCYSMKKAFHSTNTDQIIPGFGVGDYMRHLCKTYYEFPPVFSGKENRWGLPWETYGTPDPLLTEVVEDYQGIYMKELDQYTRINYVELK